MRFVIDRLPLSAYHCNFYHNKKCGVKKLMRLENKRCELCIGDGYIRKCPYLVTAEQIAEDLKIFGHPVTDIERDIYEIQHGKLPPLSVAVGASQSTQNEPIPQEIQNNLGIHTYKKYKTFK